MSEWVEMDEVQTAYRNRPDPSEPWRYTCPDCGKSTISVRRSSSTSGSPPFYCRYCTSKIEYVIDEKTGNRLEQNV